MLTLSLINFYCNLNFGPHGYLILLCLIVIIKFAYKSYMQNVTYWIGVRFTFSTLLAKEIMKENHPKTNGSLVQSMTFLNFNF